MFRPLIFSVFFLLFADHLRLGRTGWDWSGLYSSRHTTAETSLSQCRMYCAVWFFRLLGHRAQWTSLPFGSILFICIIVAFLGSNMSCILSTGWRASSTDWELSSASDPCKVVSHVDRKLAMRDGGNLGGEPTVSPRYLQEVWRWGTRRNRWKDLRHHSSLSTWNFRWRQRYKCHFSDDEHSEVALWK